MGMIVFLILLISQFNLLLAKTETLNNLTVLDRSQRQVNSLPLVYPYGAVLKFIIALSVPIEISDGFNIGFAANMQFQYSEFDNITQLSQYYFIKTVSREQRELEWEHRKDERLIFYKSVIGLMEAKGMNGQECMFRAICEAAQFPVEEEGMIGNIMHILLTPDYGQSPFKEDQQRDESLAPFVDAATAGRQMFDCPSIYQGCPEGQGFLELVTQLVDQ